MELNQAVQAFCLLFAANAVPWMLGHVLGSRWNTPVDCGQRAWDGERVFGAHKTWRGLLSGTLATGIVAQVFGLRFALGLGFGALSLLGDLASSCIKRRLRLTPGSELFGVDQLLEALLPLAIFAQALHLKTSHLLVAAIGFSMFDLLATRVRQRVGG
jgi:CDP-archaeol synthase